MPTATRSPGACRCGLGGVRWLPALVALLLVPVLAHALLIQLREGGADVV
ncbi:MAG: hypothetical protein IT509_02130 [Rhodocyclaceae bacterium]|nr:hypothetical protein [Rhodocyclaceae bacterium]